MKSYKSLKRTQLRRSPLRRTGGIRAQSPKRAAVAPERRAFVAEILSRRTVCEAQADDCRGRTVDVHEPLTRARGGSILDEANTMAICRPCHGWIHDHPKLATEKGFLMSRPRPDD